MTSGWRLRPAAADDLAAVEMLLRAADLPLQGVAEHFASFVVAQGNERLIGAAGLEIHHQCGFLRSLVVAPAWRKAGIGHALTQHLLSEARTRELQSVYLLTTDAEDYFSKMNFRRVERDEVAPAVRGSVEFVSACPTSATAMRFVT